MAFGQMTTTNHLPDGSDVTQQTLVNVTLVTRKLGKVELSRVIVGGERNKDGVLINGEIVLEKSVGKVPDEWRAASVAAK